MTMIPKGYIKFTRAMPMEVIKALWKALSRLPALNQSYKRFIENSMFKWSQLYEEEAILMLFRSWFKCRKPRHL